MSRPSHLQRFALVLAGLIMVCCPQTAHARRGFFLITTGNTVKHLGDVTAERQAEIREATEQMDDVRVGYLHDRFGVFWVDVWTWGGEYVLYNDSDTVWEIDEADAASLLGAPSGRVGKPFFYTVPPGVVVLGVLGLVWGVKSSRDAKRAKAERQELEQAANDPRYQRALATLTDYYRRRDEAGASGEQPTDPAISAAADQAAFDKAAQSITEQGIPREDAERRLWMLVSAAYARA
jgi:hypothetical protein